MISKSFIGFFILYFLIEIFYFKIARKYNIIDRPNHRSSHLSATVRGAGIIFPISLIFPIFISKYSGYIHITIALLAISLISFLDDIFTLNSKVRVIFHFFSVLLLISQFSDTYHFLLGLTLLIIITGIINAYNFMDGVNGITVLYSIVIISTLFWVSQFMVTIVPIIYFLSLLASLFVFSFFNFRSIAKCFSGDIGSVSIAFIICFLLLRLIEVSYSPIWVLFLGIYGIDTVFTIFCRLLRRESIFKAHRSHFYQFLVNELKVNPLKVAVLYSVSQLIVNMLVVVSYKTGHLWIAFSVLFVFFLLYITFRLRLEGKYRLFSKY